MAQNVQKTSIFEGLKPTNTQEYTPTPTPVPVVQKELRTKRLQLVFKPSLFRRLDEYARIHDTSKNDIVHNLVEEFLDREGYNG